MEWKTIRAQYERLFNDAKKMGATQETVARAGGLRQNKISKILDNGGRGPQVETFVKAVEGLGITVSSFFLQIEVLQSAASKGHTAPPVDSRDKGVTSDSPIPPPTTEADRDLYRKLAEVLIYAAEAGTAAEQLRKTAGAEGAPPKGGRKPRKPD